MHFGGDAVCRSRVHGSKLRGGPDEALWRSGVGHHHNGEESGNAAAELRTVPEARLSPTLLRRGLVHRGACGAFQAVSLLEIEMKMGRVVLRFAFGQVSRLVGPYLPILAKQMKGYS